MLLTKLHEYLKTKDIDALFITGYTLPNTCTIVINDANREVHEHKEADLSKYKSADFKSLMNELFDLNKPPNHERIFSSFLKFNELSAMLNDITTIANEASCSFVSLNRISYEGGNYGELVFSLD